MYAPVADADSGGMFPELASGVARRFLKVDPVSPGGTTGLGIARSVRALTTRQRRARGAAVPAPAMVSAKPRATQPFADSPVDDALEKLFHGRRFRACETGPEREDVASAEGAETVEKVGRLLSGISIIGEARNALERAGWCATITANRLTVNEEVLAQLIPTSVGSFGAVDAYWVIYTISGSRPVWIVGAEGAGDIGSAAVGGVDVRN